jgi:hypothetical protein
MRHHRGVNPSPYPLPQGEGAGEFLPSIYELQNGSETITPPPLAGGGRGRGFSKNETLQRDST